MMSIFAQEGQNSPAMDSDAIVTDSIVFTPQSASAYLDHLLQTESVWSERGEEMKYSLGRLVDHARESFDSVAPRLTSFPFDSVSFRDVAFVSADTLQLYWLNDSSFIISYREMMRNPIIVKEIIEEPEAHLDFLFSDTLPDIDVLYDSLFQAPDTTFIASIDTAYLDSLQLQLYAVTAREITPQIAIPDEMSHLSFLADSTGIVFSDTSWAMVADEDSPFYILPNEYMTDSLKFAVGELLQYTAERDSIMLFISDINGHKTPLWLGLGDEELQRFWVKNYRNDSITIWMGNPSSNNLSLYLEDEVDINRMTKQAVDDIPITLAVPETELAAMEPLEKVPIIWEYDLATSLAFSQTLLSQYWAKGGQSSLSTLLDILGETKYNDVEKKQKWISSARLKYGSILIGGQKYGLRSNTDLFEINSQYNKEIKGKFDFSAVFYMKNQIARGYKYPTDSTREEVSRFLNPGTFTVGVGVEYKPFKHTEINFSPLSYKNTFVLDTAHIDQTKHGIEAGRRNKQELGSQLVMKNKFTILQDLEINNSLRMFASYTSQPMSVDFDWEINLKKQITWFFAVSANLHMIYDKDILFSIMEDGVPVKLPDGSQLKEPRLQFKEFVGLSVSFKF